MGTAKSPKRVLHYADSFNARAVQLSKVPGVLVEDVAESLDIHPYMLSRWRKEYREGRIGRGAKIEPDPKIVSELQRLRRLEREHALLKEEHDLPKESHPVLLRGKSAKFAFIEQNRGRHRISRMCRLYGVTRVGYYAWRCRPPSAPEHSPRDPASRRVGSSRSYAGLTTSVLALLLGMFSPGCASLGSHPVPPTPEKGTTCLIDECHVQMAEKVAEAKVQHNPVKMKGCEACHLVTDKSQPHGQLTRPTPDLCFSCHAVFGNKIRLSTYRHTPVREGRCTLCHDPHGADGIKLLKNWRPLSDIDWGKYGGSSDIRFCTECHGMEFIQAKTTDQLTAFREGMTNLHYLHVLQKKGRPCRACHDTHAANQPWHIRPDVPFGTGGWKLPISVTKTENGATCVVGCHPERSYDRSHRAP